MIKYSLTIEQIQEMDTDFTKCFNCLYRKTSGLCERTACGYTPIKPTNTSEIKQEVLGVEDVKD